MNRQELESIRKNNAAVVKKICGEYGLFGNVIYHEPSPIPGSSLNRMYIVAGVDPVFEKDKLPNNLHPDEMQQAIHRNPNLFYPRAWVFDLKENNDEVAATQSLVDFCRKSEFLTRLYGEYNMRPPKFLRLSEVNQLINYRNTLDNPMATPGMKRKCKKDLDWFFRREKSKSKFRQNWLQYFRSEKFPDDKGPVAKILGFLRRDKNEIPLDQLMDNNSNISKLEMQEYEFKIFQELMEKQYPFVTYAAGEKRVVDHGLSKATQRDDSPFGKCVSAEEYAVVRKERFATEGWDCVANLKPAYWEFRDVYYKDCDAPIIASVYQHITLQYAQPNSIGELRDHGVLSLQKVPVKDFMNFVSLAKANHLRFYVDTRGDFEKPVLDTVNVVYNDHQKGKMSEIMGRMVKDKVTFSHIMETPARPALNSFIRGGEEKRRILPSQKGISQKTFQK